MMLRPLRRLFCTIRQKMIRNVAIIAHVDHGKTTLVDKLLRETNSIASDSNSERVMDSGDLEKERGITILSKCTSVFYKNHLINLVDTPGHSDFGGEVERILKMVDGVLLVVDVSEGPMAQTKFVLAKSLKKGLKSILVLNKVDRNEQRAEDAELEVLELYEELNAPENLKNFSVCYASAKNGWAIKALTDERKSMAALLDTIVEDISPPQVDIDKPFTFLVSLLSYDQHLGRILTGKVNSGKALVGDQLKAIDLKGEPVEKSKILKILANRGIKQESIPEAIAGDIVSIAGFNKATVTDTICDQSVNEPISSDTIDPPTLEISVSVNTSPLQGKEGNKITSTHIFERLQREGQSNVAINVKPLPDGISFSIKGRGELQLGVLLETMRREGFELEIGPPKVLIKFENGKKLEPIEKLLIEVDENYVGVIIENLTKRKGELIEMNSLETSGKTRLHFEVPSRSIIGFESELKNLSRGSGIMNREFKEYGSYKGEIASTRKGSIISMTAGMTTNFSLANAESKGTLFVGPNEEVYEGMIIGETTTEKDILVSPVKTKKLSNIRAAGSDEYFKLTPARKMPLEKVISYMKNDELIEITPKCIRLRKKILNSNLRAKMRKNAKAE